MKTIKIGITGSSGFIGSHLIDRLRREDGVTFIECPDSYFENLTQLKKFVGQCHTIVHLAAMNRGEPDELYEVNIRLVNDLVLCMEEMNVKPHVIFSSSTQRELDNPYGRSKKEGERILMDWAGRTGAALTLLTIPNVYGDRCKPFYNSVVATFCFQLTHGRQPEIHLDKELELIYINELTNIIYRAIQKPPKGMDKIQVQATKKATVSELLAILEGFRDFYFNQKVVPALSTPFLSNLYNVFLSYMEYEDYRQAPVIHKDSRGDLFEIIKLEQGGQIFFSTTKPGVVRGNHYHTRKIERFCVLKGKAVIRLRRIGTEKVQEYLISENEPAFIEIPIFHTHNIENVGQKELYTLFWANELFDPEDADTFYEEV